MNSIIYYNSNQTHTNTNKGITRNMEFNNKIVKKIVNVYQPFLLNGKPEGFGDYLRGSISLSVLCKILNLDFAMNIKNHPMSKYINTENHEDTEINYENIIGFSDVLLNGKCLKSIIDYVNNCNQEICYLYTNLIIDNRMIKQYYNVSNDIKENITKFILPNINITNDLNETLIID